MTVELKAIVLIISLLIVFIIFIIGIVYIILRASYEFEELVEVEQLDFLNWIKLNCRLVSGGEWYYQDEPESSESLLEIYNRQKDE